MIKAIHKFNQKGFTLIELLIVVAIIAILAAIAIPQFSQYRKRGYNAAANSDLRNLRTGEEAMFADFQDYGVTRIVGPVPNTGFSGTGEVQLAGQAFSLCGASSATTCQTVTPSPSTQLVAHSFVAAGKNVRYLAASKHTNGDVIYGVDSTLTQPYRHAGMTATALLDSDISVPGDGGATTYFAAPDWVAMQ